MARRRRARNSASHAKSSESQPDRRQQHVEDDERDSRGTHPPQGPAPQGHRRLRLHLASGAAASALPALHRAQDLLRRLLDRQLRDVDHGAAEPPLHRSRLVEARRTPLSAPRSGTVVGTEISHARSPDLGEAVRHGSSGRRSSPDRARTAPSAARCPSRSGRSQPCARGSRGRSTAASSRCARRRRARCRPRRDPPHSVVVLDRELHRLDAPEVRRSRAAPASPASSARPARTRGRRRRSGGRADRSSGRARGGRVGASRREAQGRRGCRSRRPRVRGRSAPLARGPSTVSARGVARPPRTPAPETGPRAPARGARRSLPSNRRRCGARPGAGPSREEASG